MRLNEISEDALIEVSRAQRMAETRAYEDRVFGFCLSRASSALSIVRDLRSRMDLLSSLCSFRTLPVGDIRRCADELRAIAEEMDRVADEGEPKEVMQ